MPKYAPLEQGDPTTLGSYEVVGRLGAGGQGAVYLGRTGDGQFVAIKLLHAQMNADPQARARFVREVAAAQKVEPFCTARIIEAQVDGDSPYVVSEYIEGPSLHELVATGGPRPAQELNLLAIGMLTALAAIHEVGIVHRDFKPNNVLIAADGPRVVDFGIARTVNSQESAVTATGMVVGTPGYLAPEQLTGAPLQPAVDIFAFGATMIFAATGQSPFEADTLPVIINRILNEEPDITGLPPELRPLIARCLSKDASLRPSALDALLELVPRSGAAPSSATQREELLNQGTRIAAQLPTPPAPHTPTPAPFASPANPYAAAPPNPYAASPGPVSPPSYTPPPTPGPLSAQPSPQAFQQPGQPTPPPFQQSGFQPGLQQAPHQQPGYPQQGPYTPTPQPQFGQAPPPPPPYGGPGYPQQNQPFGGQPPRRKSNGAVVAAIAGAVVVVLLLVIAIAIALPDDKPADPVVAPPPTQQAPVNPVPPSKSQDNNTGSGTGNKPDCGQQGDTAFCEDYAGTWTGLVTQVKPESAQYYVKVTFTNGSPTGEIVYTNGPNDKTTWSCSGTVTFLHHPGTSVWKSIARENITKKDNATCPDVTYNEFFPKDDGVEMFITNFSTQAAADDGSGEYSFIGTLTRQ
ncbi:serine/threonine-protein kinase [Actinocorallia sp. A-T 12471]|uniref:serine/threonine protein kinase n=1 Tax=Actinocorallia sp. A-T 12471 TaxID=3089813 RepID=UPI0029CCE9A3|nr:serine/threonine-protein kinase [Actinocorallia sp. A-T 12471]MDX6739757.1 serine/threonine-protein kinase [Actinocorallia sp. A-T 12471]